MNEEIRSPRTIVDAGWHSPWGKVNLDEGRNRRDMWVRRGKTMLRPRMEQREKLDEAPCNLVSYMSLNVELNPGMCNLRHSFLFSANRI